MKELTVQGDSKSKEVEILQKYILVCFVFLSIIKKNYRE